MYREKEINFNIDYQFYPCSIIQKVKENEGIKEKRKPCFLYFSICVWIVSKVLGMRLYIVVFIIILYTTCNTVNEVECTIITDTKRTLPYDFSPSDWWQSFKNFLANGGYWKLHKNISAGILRIFSPLNGKTGSMMISFDHEYGPRASRAYQQRFGFHGQRLVELLGTGLKSYQPDIKQPVLEYSLTPPLPIFSVNAFQKSFLRNNNNNNHDDGS